MLGNAAIFKAEGVSAPLNSKLNDHISSMHLIKAQSALAENERVRTFFLAALSIVFSPLVLFVRY